MGSPSCEHPGRCGRLARTDRGATATEYAIMAGFIAAVIVGAVTLFGQSVLGLFQSLPLTAF